MSKISRILDKLWENFKKIIHQYFDNFFVEIIPKICGKFLIVEVNFWENSR